MKAVGNEKSDGGDIRCCGLLFGVSPRMIRLVCESPNVIDSKARGQVCLTPGQVGDMTIDQIYFLLTKLENLRSDGFQAKKAPAEVMALGDAEGVKARSADGTPITLKFGGESLASRLAKGEQQKDDRAKRRERRRKRRERIRKRRERKK